MEFDSASLDRREPFGDRLYQSCLLGVRAIFENVKNPGARAFLTVRGRPPETSCMRTGRPRTVHGRSFRCTGVPPETHACGRDVREPKLEIHEPKLGVRETHTNKT